MERTEQVGAGLFEVENKGVLGGLKRTESLC